VANGEHKGNGNSLAVNVRGVTKTFGTGEAATHALKGVDFDTRLGEMLMIVGPSGCGKTTLLSVIAGTLDFEGGEIEVLNTPLHRLKRREITEFRKRNVGFIFQQFNLIPVLTALENVELPLKLTGLKKAERIEHATTALKLVGLGDRVGHFPRQLSGGQEQRVAIARAIVTDPALILADEPTGNLDAASALEVLTILSKLNKDYGKTIVMVTHDPHAAQFATKVHHLEKGELAADAPATASQQ